MKKTNLPFFLLIVSFLFALNTQAQVDIHGFAKESVAKQLELESSYDKFLKSDNLDAWNKLMSSHPHHVGSPWGKKNAEFMLAQFKKWGYDATIEEYQVMFPTPKIRIVEMLEPISFKASLSEPPVKGDPSTAQLNEMLPPYNSFSIDGDVTAELVYVNYGIPADYEELEKMGIDVKGKIVIAKYYGSWRGIKPKVAAEHGAIGCIIYSDPKEDGYFQGDVYPEGPYKLETGVQRGSVLDMPLYPGDPLTPGYGATADAKRLEIKDAPTITAIPVLPISYKDAQPLLAALKGPVAPASWRGALPITYHVGPGPAKVHLKLEFDWKLTPAYNVIAKMKGSTYPDEWVIRGNHHDGWVHGSSDPVSGMVALMEEARGVSELVKTGWKPKRTLVYCAWDAEEPALLGSTEWAEDHKEELQQKAVVYINTDGNSRGFLGAGGSHTLEKYVDQVSRQVTDPQKGISVFERRQAAALVQGAPAYPSYKLSAPGAGSDYTPFVHHLGIPIINLGFGGEGGGGEYHTNFDTYEHYSKYKDPGFVYGVTLAKVAGRLSLRMANADILPFDFKHFYNTVNGYAKEVMKLADDQRAKIERENMLITGGMYEAAADPKKQYVIPEPKEEVPYFDFSPIQNAMVQLEKSSNAYAAAIQSSNMSEAEKAKLNQMLMDMERLLIKDHGLPRRSWYKHHIYAPGFYTGYGVKTFPGVREAIEQRNYKEAQEQVMILGEVLQGFSKEIEKATAIMKKNRP